MIHSKIDDPIGKMEFDLLHSQEHLEKVWKIMQTKVEKYADDYLEGVSHYKDMPNVQDSFSKFLTDMIKKNSKLHDKYTDIFDIELMESEYSEDITGFKNNILKRECDVIKNTLLSKTESLNEWKAKFLKCKEQKLYDTFYNIMFFAKEYCEKMDEASMEKLDSIDDCTLRNMEEEEECYARGILGFGIVSNILNHMQPRVFPGNYKAGVYSLYFLSGGGKGIDMPSESSEFCMVKDDSISKTGIIETEHNYYFPYENFCIY